ncbi:hypothetical protein K439DRAFT_1624665 [Ramaria rubella]|nr:hypothetical protein K439DRAFT_1624665 [Ramaria rubella]
MARFSLDDWAGNGQTAYCAVPEDAQKLFWPSRTLHSSFPEQGFFKSQTDSILLRLTGIAEHLHPVPKFGNLKLNPKDVKHQEDLENDLDAVDDPPETVEWLDGENETIDANRTGFDIKDSVDLQSETLRMLLANSSMQPLEKQKTTEKPMHRNAEMLGVVSWGFE